MLFPTPDAPTIATISPRSHVEVEVAQHVKTLGADDVGLVQPGDGDERHHSNRSACTGSSRDAWRDG